MKHWNERGTGLLLCLCIAIPCWMLGRALPVIGGPVFAILAGMAIALLVRDKGWAQAGIAYTSKTILQYAVILLGFGLNLSEVAKVGVQSLPIILSTITTSLVVSFLLHRLLHIPSNISTLVGVGSSVCGGSAMREAAEETLRNMLQEDFQLTIADAFPVNRAALRELMQKEIEAQKAEQQTAIREEGRVEIGEAGDLAFLFDEAAADDLMNVLEHADCRSCGNQEILKIILDEADAFFKGRKTAQEAAQVMDRRAALFIAEAG